jgi:hypothetical protein
MLVQQWPAWYCVKNNLGMYCKKHTPPVLSEGLLAPRPPRGLPIVGCSCLLTTVVSGNRHLQLQRYGGLPWSQHTNTRLRLLLLLLLLLLPLSSKINPDFINSRDYLYSSFKRNSNLQNLCCSSLESIVLFGAQLCSLTLPSRKLEISEQLGVPDSHNKPFITELKCRSS